jgi:hypothetical protein
MTIATLYEQMAQHTQPECGRCPVPFSCCSAEYCDMATEYAASQGVVLVPGTHPRLPHMTDIGCAVHPMYRPLCTVHTCAIGNFGEKLGDPEWTEAYFSLRDQINEAELVRLEEEQLSH